MTVAITGANGKLGRALVVAFAQKGYVHAIAREKPKALPKNAIGFGVGPLHAGTDFSTSLKGIETLVHCAALTWIDPSITDRSEFTTVNVDATRALAQQAIRAGIKRIIFISSLTVHGKHNIGRPFRADDEPSPQSLYSQSKWEGEKVLRLLAIEHGIEVIVIRPPHIIWPELSGNLALMEKFISKGIPLPFGLLDQNARDNVASEKLVAEIVRIAAETQCAEQILLVSDRQPMSTRALCLWLSNRVSRKPILLPIPQRFLRLIVELIPRQFVGKLNRRELWDELTKDLRID